MNHDSSISRAEFVRVGQATWDLGLNSLKSGNMSLLLPNRRILITRTGRSLRGLNPETDLIAVDSRETERGEASCEFYVHRGIYLGVKDHERGAILHCHGPCTIAATCVLEDHIPPSYNEAKDVLGRTPNPTIPRPGKARRRCRADCGYAKGSENCRSPKPWYVCIGGNAD